MLNVNYELLAEKVKDYKKAKWLTYQELEDKLNVPQNVVLNFIHKGTKLHFETVLKICNVLNINLSEIGILPTEMSTGEKLKYYRALRGYTIVQLSKISGLSADILGLIENNKRRLTPANRLKLIKVLDLPSDELLDTGVTTGERIRLARQEQGLTQGELCEKLGWTPRKLSAFERNLTVVSKDELKAISVCLNKPIKYFIS